MYTPAHVKKARGPPKARLLSGSERVKLRALFSNHRYKQCITYCEELLTDSLHPLHSASLYFYEAICYESLGLIAHKYSTSKIPFLDLAKENFSLSLQFLPQPYSLYEGGNYAIRRTNSMDTTRSKYDTPLRSSHTRAHSMIETPLRTRNGGNSSSVIHQDDSPSSTYHEFNCNEENGKEDSEIIFKLRTRKRHNTHDRYQLAQSVSYDHILADELIPSPLFSRQRAALQSIQSNTTPRPPQAFLLNTRTRSSTETSFSSTGTTISPRKSSTVQTLIQHYENHLPQLTTPITPRFTQIQQIFSPLPSNPHLQTYLSSISLEKYHFHLASFRTALINHLSSIEGRIHAVIAVQAARKKSKSHSFWSFQPAQDQAKREKIDQLKRDGWIVNKEKHGWKGAAYYEALRKQAESELR